MRPEPIAKWSELADRTPTGALVEGVDLVIVRYDDDHSVLYGRCEHRGALMADGFIVGVDIVCAACTDGTTGTQRASRRPSRAAREALPRGERLIS